MAGEVGPAGTIESAAALVWERVMGPLVQRGSGFDFVDLGLQIRPVRGLVLRVEVKVLEPDKLAGGGITPLFLRALVGESGVVAVWGASMMLTSDVVVCSVAFEVRNLGSQARSVFDTIFGSCGGLVISQRMFVLWSRGFRGHSIYDEFPGVTVA